MLQGTLGFASDLVFLRGLFNLLPVSEVCVLSTKYIMGLIKIQKA